MKKKDITKEQLLITINDLENGICEEDNYVRPFDSIDYHIAFDDTAPNTVRMRAKELNIKQNKSFNTMTRTTWGWQEHINIKSEINNKQILNVDGILHEVTKEEKLRAITYITELNDKGHKIPLTQKVYVDALLRIIRKDRYSEKKEKISKRKKSI